MCRSMLSTIKICPVNFPAGDRFEAVARRPIGIFTMKTFEWSDLPEDLVRSVLQKTDARSLVRLAAVNRGLRDSVRDVPRTRMQKREATLRAVCAEVAPWFEGPTPMLATKMLAAGFELERWDDSRCGLAVYTARRSVAAVTIVANDTIARTLILDFFTPDNRPDEPWYVHLGVDDTRYYRAREAHPKSAYIRCGCERNRGCSTLPIPDSWVEALEKLLPDRHKQS